MEQSLHVIISLHLIITLSFIVLENIYQKSIYIKSLRTAYRYTREPLMLSVLTLMSVNMFAEGYIFYGGSFLAFLFWITIGVCSDQEYEIIYDEETDNEETGE